MQGSYTYAQAKQAMRDAGYTVSDGPYWYGPDQAQWEIFILTKTYESNSKDLPPYDPYGLQTANAAFAFDVAPTWLKTLVTSGTPSSNTPGSSTPGV